MMKKRILVMIDWFEPAFKAGGPIRSGVNFAREMKDDYEVFILTGDRDFGESQSLHGIVSDRWIKNDWGINLYYCSPGSLTFRKIKAIVLAVGPDFVYLNSMFSRFFSLYPLLYSRLGLLQTKVVMAPRGMLKKSALATKSGKKNIYLSLFRLLRLHKGVHFQATDYHEEQEIVDVFGNVAITVAGNFSGHGQTSSGYLEKQQGKLSVIFVGRIHPIKNLDYLLRRLEQVRGAVSLTIAGPMEDMSYWELCSEIIRNLPGNITIDYKGEVDHKNLAGLIDKHHIFALPTKGENFGHAIAESLAQGRPVLISDQTPWKELRAAQAGWDIPLDKPEQFVEALQEAVNWSQTEFETRSSHALTWYQGKSETGELKKVYTHLFN